MTQHLVGDAWTLVYCANALRDVAERATANSALITRFAEGDVAADGEGKSVAAIVERTGTTGVDLSKAALRLEGVADALSDYASTLTLYQDKINTAFDELMEIGPRIQRMEQEVEATTGDTDDMLDDIAVLKQQQAALIDDYERLQRLFEEGYERALAMLSKANDGANGDSMLDDWSKSFDDASNVLEDIGLVSDLFAWTGLGAVVGTVVSVLDFGTTVAHEGIELVSGREPWWEAAFAVGMSGVSLIPFSQVASALFKHAGFVAFGRAGRGSLAEVIERSLASVTGGAVIVESLREAWIEEELERWADEIGERTP